MARSARGRRAKWRVYSDHITERDGKSKMSNYADLHQHRHTRCVYDSSSVSLVYTKNKAMCRLIIEPLVYCCCCCCHCRCFRWTFSFCSIVDLFFDCLLPFDVVGWAQLCFESLHWIPQASLPFINN